ncbi:helix-turn-helix transcriptional regulator [Actinomadura hibisca]|uniref:helix-turn-helix transcriptional regulator n=1 Tax=Actinomadura hibisca TaxID=68565 RepID=UPI00083541C5|nr:LuxR C-terminal-related transcriptional regulator [Actinomadura hibisca]
MRRVVGLLRDGDAAGWLPEVTGAVYRVVREALTNGRRHAPGARSVVVVGRDGHGVTVEVTDDGPVPVRSHQRGGFGLVGMRERVETLGGSPRAGPRPTARGCTNQEIASELFISLSTVKGHVAAVQAKLGVRKRVGIAAWAWENGSPTRGDAARDRPKARSPSAGTALWAGAPGSAPVSRMGTCRMRSSHQSWTRWG